MALYSHTKHCIEEHEENYEFGFFWKCSLKTVNLESNWKKQGEPLIVTHDVTAKVSSLKEKKVPQ